MKQTKGVGLRALRGGKGTYRSSLADFLRVDAMPYGQRVCEDGTEVLFNRQYAALWMRRPGEAPVPADPFVYQGSDKVWFYNDSDAEKKKVASAMKVMHEWGLPDPRLA